MMTRLALILLTVLALASPAAAQSAFSPVVMVNDDVVTYYDVAQRAKLLEIRGGQPGAQLNSLALEQLISDRLRTQEAERLGVSAQTEEIEAAVADFAATIDTGRETLLARMRRNDVKRATLDDLLRAEVLWRKVIRSRFGGRAEPTEMELDQEIALAAAGGSESYRIAEIGIPAGDDRGAARAQAARLSERLGAGGDFAAAARRYSRAPSARAGGEVGWVPESALPLPVAQAIDNLNPGEVSPPISLPGGVSIVKLLETRTERPPWAGRARLELARVTVPMPAGDSAEAAQAALDDARDLSAEIEGCADLPPGDQVEIERLPLTQLADLPERARGATRLLSAGEVSAPVRGGGGYEVYVVCAREAGADAEAREQLRRQIRNSRLSRFAEGYLQDLRREAVVERR